MIRRNRSTPRPARYGAGARVALFVMVALAATARTALGTDGIGLLGIASQSLAAEQIAQANEAFQRRLTEKTPVRVLDTGDVQKARVSALGNATTCDDSCLAAVAKATGAAKLVFGQMELLEEDHFKGTVQVYDATAGKVTTKVEKDFVWKAEKLASFVEALATSVSERLGPPSQIVVVFPVKIPRVDVSVDGEILFSPARGFKSTEMKPGKHTIRLAIVQGKGAKEGEPSPADFLIGKAEYPFELAPGTVQAFVCDTFLGIKVSCDQSSAPVPAYRPPDFEKTFSALRSDGRPASGVWSADEKEEQKARKAVLKTKPDGWTTYCTYLALSSEDWEVKEDALKYLKGQNDPFTVAAAAHIAGFYSGDDVEDAAFDVLRKAVPGRSDQYGEMINYYATMNPARAKKLRKLLE